MLKRWGEPGKEGVLEQIRTHFGTIVLWEGTIQIGSAMCTGAGTIHIHGDYSGDRSSFKPTYAFTEDWSLVERTLMMLANFLATKDFEEDKRQGRIRVLKGIGQAMQGRDSLSRIQMLTAVLTK